jgi:putative transposase
LFCFRAVWATVIIRSANRLPRSLWVPNERLRQRTNARSSRSAWLFVGSTSCLDFLGSLSSLHDVNVRLWAFLDEHYHHAPHAGLLGRAPAAVWAAVPPPLDSFDEKKLREALTTRMRRRVRRDSTVAIGGKDYELDGAHLAGRMVMLCRCLVDLSEAPWVEFEGRRLEVHPVDPVKNARRSRRLRRSEEAAPPHPAFNPPQALLDKASHRVPRKDGES